MCFHRNWLPLAYSLFLFPLDESLTSHYCYCHEPIIEAFKVNISKSSYLDKSKSYVGYAMMKTCLVYALLPLGLEYATEPCFSISSNRSNRCHPFTVELEYNSKTLANLWHLLSWENHLHTLLTLPWFVPCFYLNNIDLSWNRFLRKPRAWPYSYLLRFFLCHTLCPSICN